MDLQDINEFADIIGFSAWMVERWEGQKTQPTLEALCRVREKLMTYYPEITLEDLIDYNDESPEEGKSRRGLL